MSSGIEAWDNTLVYVYLEAYCLREVVLWFVSELSPQIHVLNICSPVHGIILGASGNWKWRLGFDGRNR